MTSVRLLRPLLRSALPRHTPTMGLSQGSWSRGPDVWTPGSDLWRGPQSGPQSPTMNMVPIVIEQTGRGERSYDIYSRYRHEMTRCDI